MTDENKIHLKPWDLLLVLIIKQKDKKRLNWSAPAPRNSDVKTEHSFMECQTSSSFNKQQKNFNLAHSTIYNPKFDARWKSYNQTVMPRSCIKGSLKECWRRVAVFPISHLQQNIKRTRFPLIAPAHRLDEQGSLLN